VAFSGISFMMTGCKESPVEPRPELSHNTWHLPVAEVTVQELTKSYIASGSVISDQRIDVASRTTGFIRKIFVREGERDCCCASGCSSGTSRPEKRTLR